MPEMVIASETRLLELRELRENRTFRSLMEWLIWRKDTAQRKVNEFHPDSGTWAWDAGYLNAMSEAVECLDNLITKTEEKLKEKHLKERIR